jgi:hypothetical protein
MGLLHPRDSVTAPTTLRPPPQRGRTDTPIAEHRRLTGRTPPERPSR